MGKYLGSPVEFQGDCCTRSYFSMPEGKTVRHGLVIVPEIWGISGRMKETADSFARQGFAVIVPDIYTSGAVSGELSESEIQSVQELGRFDHNRLAEAGNLESELSKLPEKKRKDIEKVMRVFRNGSTGHELCREILRTVGNFISRGLVAGDKIKFMVYSPSGGYPSMPKEFQDVMEEENRRLTILESELKKLNPVDPKLHSLLKRKEERLYCLMPFTHMDVSMLGIRCCSWLVHVAGLNTVPLDEADGIVTAWKSDYFERVRESVRDGTYRHCKLSCCAEVRGDQKNLLTLGEMRDKYPAITDYIMGKNRKYGGMLEYVSISIDASCNLSCPSCSRLCFPDISSEKRGKIIGTLKEAGRNLRIIHLAGMGEVFFSPMYLDWIMNFRREDYPALERIYIITNGLKLTPELWSRLPADFTRIIHTIIISIDGATKSTYEENRRGGNFEVLLENLGFIKTLREKGEIWKLRAYFVYQANNYSEMPGMIDLAFRYSFDEVYFERLMNWGSYDAREYENRDIGNPRHPGHERLEAVKNEVLGYKEGNMNPVIVFMS